MKPDDLIVILCNECGQNFLETVERHLDGHGCPICDGKQYAPVNVCRAIAEGMLICDGDTDCDQQEDGGL